LNSGKKTFVGISLLLALGFCLGPSFTAFAAVPTAASPSGNPIIETMNLELHRSLAKLKNAGKAPLYYLAYRLYEGNWESITASNGAIIDESLDGRWRMLSVDLRVGSKHFDNTHFLRGKNSSSPHHWEKSTKTHSILPGDGAGLPLQQCLWLATDDAYKDAQQRFAELQASNEVMSSEEDKSDDFSSQPIHKYSGPIKSFKIDRDAWQTRLRRLSRLFLNHSSLLQSSKVSLSAEPTTRYIVDSEGSEEIEQSLNYRVGISASTLAKDGMTLSLYDSVESPDPNLLPDEATLAQRAEKLCLQLEKLREAPVAEPYVGPAILSPKAAAVFFHETFGHRIESVHERSENEGKTFSKKIGTQVMPRFITVIDDPTITKAHGEFLNGHYVFDDEGVPGQKVVLAKNGILTALLTDRTLVKGVNASNGHGRSSPGWNPVARQSNLFVIADKTKQVTPKKLRAMLVDEARRQHKAYGLYFDEISGGYTYTESGSEQTYFVNPLVVYKVFVDGRADQLIRGLEIVGTPLAALERITAAGDDLGVFNGRCGRESGQVPVSSVAPSLFVQSIETKRRAKSYETVPILPDPAMVKHQ
jgi:predicted Zn-dependent protease